MASTACLIVYTLLCAFDVIKVRKTARQYVICSVVITTASLCYAIDPNFGEVLSCEDYELAILIGLNVVQSYFVFLSMRQDTLYWRGEWGIETLRKVGDNIDSDMRLPLIPDQQADALQELVDKNIIEMIDFSKIQFKQSIGKGATCTVYRGVYGERDVAIKCYTPPELSRGVIRAFYGEAKLLRSFNHPNMVALIGMLISPPYFCLVFELCDRGPLDVHLKTIANWDWSKKLHFMAQIASSVAYIHGRKPPVVHRDIKPDNFLLRHDWTPVLADFGSSRALLRPANTFAGTPLWMAPEVLAKKSYDVKADIFSLGVLFWQLVTGGRPHEDITTFPNLKDRVLAGDRPSMELAAFDKCPEAFFKVLSDCWAHNPQARPSAQELVERLHALCEEEKALLLRPSHLDDPQAISSGRYRMNSGDGIYVSVSNYSDSLTSRPPSNSFNPRQVEKTMGSFQPQEVPAGFVAPATSVYSYKAYPN